MAMPPPAAPFAAAPPLQEDDGLLLRSALPVADADTARQLSANEANANSLVLLAAFTDPDPGHTPPEATLAETEGTAELVTPLGAPPATNGPAAGAPEAAAVLPVQGAAPAALATLPPAPLGAGAPQPIFVAEAGFGPTTVPLAFAPPGPNAGPPAPVFAVPFAVLAEAAPAAPGGIAIEPAAEPPDDVVLSEASIAEDAVPGTLVGRLTATDPDGTEPLAWEIVGEAGPFMLLGDAIVVAPDAMLDFEGTPRHSLTVRATDSDGLSVERTLEITVTDVNEAPSALPIGPQQASEDAAFVFAPSAGDFTDPDFGDTLTFSATLADGSPLPSWLSFDPATGALSGTPGNDDVGQLDVRLTATDEGGLAVSRDFALDVVNVNDAPVAATSASITLGFVGSEAGYRNLVGYTYIDAATGERIGRVLFDEDTAGRNGATNVTITGLSPSEAASLQLFTIPNGAALNALNDATGQAAGLRNDGLLGGRDRAIDDAGREGGSGGAGDAGFAIRVIEVPVSGAAGGASGTIGQVVLAEAAGGLAAGAVLRGEHSKGSATALGADAGKFSAFFTDAALNPFDRDYAATVGDRGDSFQNLPGGTPLAAVLPSTPLQGQVGMEDLFQGTAGQKLGDRDFDDAVIDVRVVTDALALPAQVASEDTAFRLDLPAGSFTDIDRGDTLTYSATLADGSALPAWLMIDPATGTLSGTPGNDDVGRLELRITATDEAGATAIGSLDLRVANVNDAPTAIGLSALSATEGAAPGTVLATLSATDIDVGDTHRFTLVDGGARKLGQMLHADSENAVSLAHTGTGAGRLNTGLMLTSDGRMIDSDGQALSVWRITNTGDTDRTVTLTRTGGETITVVVPAHTQTFATTSVGTAVLRLDGTQLDVKASGTQDFLTGQGTRAIEASPFEIVGNQLRLKAGASLDHEARDSYDLTIRATDAAGATVLRTVTYTVADANENQALGFNFSTDSADRGITPGGPAAFMGTSIQVSHADVASTLIENTGAWNTPKNAYSDADAWTPALGTQVTIANFVDVRADLSNAGHRHLEVEVVGGKRGHIETAAGNDQVDWVFHSNGGDWQETANISTGAGNDQVRITDVAHSTADDTLLADNASPRNGAMWNASYNGARSIARVDAGAGDDDVRVDPESLVRLIADGGTGNDTLQGGRGNDQLTGGDGHDTFLAMPDAGHDTILGGAGGSWADTIALEGLAGPPGAPGAGWTLSLTQGSVLAEEPGLLTLSQDADGMISFADGGSLTFQDIERLSFSSAA